MFETLTRVPVDPILGVSAAFQKDTSETKIDLGVGVYKDEAGKTPVPRAVKRAEQDLIAAQTSKTYLSPIGNPGFNLQVAELTFGSDFGGRKADLALAQAPGGSGALRLGAELINAARPGSTVYVSDPTWANHIPLLGSAGLKVEKYPYYDPINNTVRFEPMLDALEQLAAGSVIVLHACCHNPTGQDLSRSSGPRSPTCWRVVVCCPFSTWPTKDSAKISIEMQHRSGSWPKRFPRCLLPSLAQRISDCIASERVSSPCSTRVMKRPPSRPASSVVSREPSGRCRRITGPLLWIACCRRRSYAKTG